MAYIFRGKLCGLICPECPEPLANVVVRLYRSRDTQTVTALAVANPKETFTVLTEKQVKDKPSSLIAEAKTDDEGNFTFELGDKERYQGEAFEIDIYCATVPHLKPRPNPPAPTQFSITTLQPRWRQMETGFVAVWDYCLPHRFWCFVRALFGAWTICGRVTHCATKNPIGNVRVRAFDADWIQQDELGNAITDAQGKFRIDYVTADFGKTPFSWLNIELIGGPDLYFQVETVLGAVPLLIEPPSRGRQADRENAGPCFCVELCLEQPPPPQDEPPPVFTHLGGYAYLTDINGAPPGNGLTIGDNRAFYSTIRLNGILPKRLNGNSMEYRFEARTTDATGAPTGPWTPIAPSQIARTKIGLLANYAPAFPGDPNPVKTRDYTVNGTAGPTEVVASFTMDGWIQVPQESNVFGPEGFFQPNGNMINLISQSLAAFGAKNLTGLVAGNSSTSTGQTLAEDRHFALRMRVREAPVGGAGVDAGVCQHVAINNTLYDNINHHPSWAGYPESNALGVAMLDIAQLIADGCHEISNSLDVLFTAAHPNLGAVTVSMSGPGGPYAFTLPAAGTPGDRFGTAAPSGWTVAALPSCAYIVRLYVQLLLTTGDSAPNPLYDDIAFCKS